MMLDRRRRCEDAIEQKEPWPNYLGSNIHSAGDVNVKYILVAASFFLQIIWLFKCH